jgi:hypothetical protein
MYKHTGTEIEVARICVLYFRTNFKIIRMEYKNWSSHDS